MSPQEMASLKFVISVIMFVILIMTLRYGRLPRKVANAILILSGIVYVVLLYVLFANVPDKEFGGYIGTVILVGVAFIPFMCVATAHK